MPANVDTLVKPCKQEYMYIHLGFLPSMGDHSLCIQFVCDILQGTEEVQSCITIQVFFFPSFSIIPLHVYKRMLSQPFALSMGVFFAVRGRNRPEAPPPPHVFFPLTCTCTSECNRNPLLYQWGSVWFRGCPWSKCKFSVQLQSNPFTNASKHIHAHAHTPMHMK